MAEQRNHWERLKKRRNKKVVQRAGGKKMIHSEDEMLDHIRNKKVPTMMQHCVVKVYKKMKGNGRERFLAAYNICAAVFQNNGYLKSEQMSMTGKGLKNNRRHQRESEASRKKSKYKGMVSSLWEHSIKRLEKQEKDVE